MLPRVLETEVMATEAEAHDYDAMDHVAVNHAFAANFLLLWLGTNPVLDVCTGTALIPVELCRLNSGIQITGIDLSRTMLEVAHRNVQRAQVVDRIELRCGDAKSLPFPDQTFGAVVCNGTLHHFANPLDCLRELVRVCQVSGQLFVRDLLRPVNEAQLDWLVTTHAPGANAHQKAMLSDSLRASLTLDEIRETVRDLGYSPESVQQTSDRHWTWSDQRS